MTNPVMIWWAFLCSVALLNVVGWLFSARLLNRRAVALPASVHATRRLVLWLAAAYVAGCAFRSILPMVDVPRICLHDTPISRIVIGRSIATIAELCFAAQFALLLREAGRLNGRPLIALLAPVLLGLIVLAEIFSWSAVLTTNNLFHAVENSLWTAGAALGLIGFATLHSREDARGARFIIAVLVCGVAYIAFMTVVDVPMYLARWQADMAAGHEQLSMQQALREIVAGCTVVRKWPAWRADIPWLTLYFTTAVWISIALAHAPPLAVEPNLRQDARFPDAGVMGGRGHGPQ